MDDIKTRICNNSSKLTLDQRKMFGKFLYDNKVNLKKYGTGLFVDVNKLNDDLIIEIDNYMSKYINSLNNNTE